MTDLLLEIAEVRQILERALSRPYYPLNDGWALTHLDTGHPFFVNTRDRNITPWIIMGGTWETELEGVILDRLGPGMTFVDVGANMGYYSVKAGSRVGPTGQVIAFEPNPATLPYLRRNMAINGFGANSEIWPAAVGSQCGFAELTFTIGDEAQANIHGHGDGEQSHKVGVQRLDEVLAHLPRIDLIKIDAEGSEAQVLVGAQELLSRHDCAIVLELNLRRWEAIMPLEELVSLAGGRAVFALQGHGALLPMPSVQELRDHLLTCAFTECYVLLSR